MPSYGHAKGGKGSPDTYRDAILRNINTRYTGISATIYRVAAKNQAAVAAPGA
jgi:hypothetical protein